MASTILLDTQSWDLVTDANGDIAIASEPYALAQDAASAIKTFAGECYWDTSVGVQYMTQVLGQQPSLPLLKALLVDAALTVPGISAARAFMTGLSNRIVSGQVQVVGATGDVAAATFAVINPQGAG